MDWISGLLFTILVHKLCTNGATRWRRFVNARNKTERPAPHLFTALMALRRRMGLHLITFRPIREFCLHEVRDVKW